MMRILHLVVVFHTVLGTREHEHVGVKPKSNVEVKPVDPLANSEDTPVVPPSASDVKPVEPSCESGVSSRSLKIWTFNLEGRGGNQADPDNQARRVSLTDKFVELCSGDARGMPDLAGEEKKRPDLILTQEDTTTAIGHCYKEIVDCEAEDYWWTAEDKYGNATSMRNKIYIHRDVDAEVLDTSQVELVSKEMINMGFNQRCAAVAKLSFGGTVVTVASFHLAGGYVDDESASTQVASMAPDVKNIRKLLLTKLQHSLTETYGAESLMVIAGDTNALPEKQVRPCQENRVSWLMKAWTKSNPKFDNAEGQKEMGDNFYAYMTLPDHLESNVRRVEADHLPGASICASVADSTTVWGGQPDQFFTNLKSAKAKVLPFGMADSVKLPFKRVLSDHNPVELNVKLPQHAEGQGASQKSAASEKRLFSLSVLAFVVYLGSYACYLM